MSRGPDVGDVPGLQGMHLPTVVHQQGPIDVDVQGGAGDGAAVGQGDRHERAQGGAVLPVCRVRRLPLGGGQAELCDSVGEPVENLDQDGLPVELLARHCTASSARESQRGRGGHGQVSALLMDIEADADDDERMSQRQVFAEDSAHLPHRRRTIDGGLRLPDQHVVGPLERRPQPGDRRDRLRNSESGDQRHPSRGARRGGEHHRERHTQTGRGIPAAIQSPTPGSLHLGNDDGIRLGDRGGARVGRAESLVDLHQGKPSSG